MLQPFFDTPILGRLLYSDVKKMDGTVTWCQRWGDVALNDLLAGRTFGGAGYVQRWSHQAAPRTSCSPQSQSYVYECPTDLEVGRILTNTSTHLHLDCLASKAKAPRRRGAAVGQDILSLFLENENSTVKYSDRELRDIAMSLLLAGA